MSVAAAALAARNTQRAGTAIVRYCATGGILAHRTVTETRWENA